MFRVTHYFQHKIWKNDGFIIISGRCVKLLNEERKTIASTLSYSINCLNSVKEGSLLKVAGYHAELKILSTAVCESNANSSMNYAGLTGCVDTHGLVKADDASNNSLASVCRKPVTSRRQRCSISEALVLPRPPTDCIWSQNPEGLAIKDVVLESQFAKRLRPHQREGIVFLYECVMGFRSHRLPGQVSCLLSASDFDSPTNTPVCGCILADEMGLGKTVQAIALLWLLLNQGPYGGRPVIRRCLIVTPGSLVQNWVSEISKWLGRERLPVFCVNQGSSLKSYLTRNNISAPPVIIMSYEMFLQNSHDVYNIPHLDMVICDEGHRLKNATVHTSMVS
ncbi:hypothetical protein PHET_08719, partial [Paragonimus heterotremus]